MIKEKIIIIVNKFEKEKKGKESLNNKSLIDDNFIYQVTLYKNIFYFQCINNNNNGNYLINIFFIFFVFEK
jgi:hypothetical protein